MPKFKLNDQVWVNVGNPGVNPSFTQTTIAGVTIIAGKPPMYSLNLVVQGFTLNRDEGQVWATMDEATVACVMQN